MSDKTVLEKATARPWAVGNWEESLANAELIVLAVNNYEESAATIQSLTEALEHAKKKLLAWSNGESDMDIIDRALAQARRSK